jgi:hypothetical protein
VNSSLRFTCFGTSALLLYANGAWAQTSTARTALGQVLDEQQAAIPDAEVKVLETSRNLVRLRHLRLRLAG